MDVRELLKTTPETLAQRQYDALRGAIVSLLGKLQGHIQRGELADAQKMLMGSPAGDCMGCDNACIDCSELIERSEEGCATDIGDVIARLTHLQGLIDAAATRPRDKR